MGSANEAFTEITGDLNYPMLIVTTGAGGEHAGCLVGFATQCSIAPGRFLVCLSDKNLTFRVAQRSDALAVHFVPARAPHLAELFGSHTGDETDKFDRCRWHAGPRDLPILDECARWFAGAILERRPLGDHWGYVLEPFAVHDSGTDPLLTFSQVKHLEPGHRA
jgi:flavin reductase (DIM6/NTAB) family NADH-FMN oxidoreductase RutF